MKPKRRAKLLVLAPLAAAFILLLVLPGPRALLRLSVGQIVPARAGATYLSIWRIPACACARDVTRPYWRRWSRAYERRRGDWRVHAARAFKPGTVWLPDAERRAREEDEAGNSLDALEAKRLAETLEEYARTAALAPERPGLLVAAALAILARDPEFEIWDRTEWADDDHERPKPDWTSPEESPARLAEVERLMAAAKALDPENGFLYVVEARVLFSLGRDEEALAAMAAALARSETCNYYGELERNFQDFLLSVGAPRLEVEWRGKVTYGANDWPDACRQVERLLLAMARAAKERGDHEQAVRFVRYAAYACEASPPTWRGMVSRLYNVRDGISSISWIEGEEKCNASALAYLREHGAADLAVRVEDAIRNLEAYRARREATHKRDILIPVASYATLFGAALVLLQFVTLALVWAALAAVRGNPPELDRKTRVVRHFACAMLAFGAAVVGATATTTFLMCISYQGPAPDHSAIVRLYFVPAAGLVILVALLLTSERTGTVKESVRRRLLFVRTTLPLALVYLGYAYVALLWAAYFLLGAEQAL